MQPDHLAAERDRLNKKSHIGGNGKAKPRPNEIGREPCGEGGLRHEGRDVCHHVFGLDRPTIDSGKMGEKLRFDVRLLGCAIGPKRIYASAKRSLVVVKIRNQTCKCDCRTRRGSRALKSCNVDLLARVGIP